MIYILGVKNKNVPDPEGELNRWKDWLSSELKTDVIIEWTSCDVPLIYKEWMPKSTKYPDGVRGLANTKELLKSLPIEKDDYDIIWFFYQPDRSEKALCNLTYGDPLNTQEVYIEIPIQPEFLTGNRTYDVLVHESIHALHKLCWFMGIRTQDDLDNWGGNENNLARIRPYYAKISEAPLNRKLKTAYSSLIEALKRQVYGLTKKLRLKQWALAIQEFEGFAVGSLSWRNNNPGNIRWIGQYNAVEGEGGFAKFKTYQDGLNALIDLLQNAVDGVSSIYRPSDTLLQFFNKYAPSADNNNPFTYAGFVARKLGVTIDTKIKDI